MKKTTLILLFMFSVMLLPSLRAQESHRAALVVRMGDGAVETACVSFTEESITGYELLVQSGMPLAVDASGAGTAVCSINNTGCPATDCFCQCTGSDCVYWSYWHLVNGVWTYSQGGASVSQIGDGDVDGWSWGPGSVSDAVPPPDLSFADVCEAPATATPVTPEGTPIVINTLMPTAVLPTSTPVLVTQTSTPVQSATPTQSATATVAATAAGGMAAPTSTPTVVTSSSDGARDVPTATAVLPTLTIPPPPSTVDSPILVETAVVDPITPSPAAIAAVPTAMVAERMAVTAVTEPIPPTPAAIAVIGANDTAGVPANVAESEENGAKAIAPYAFFLLMIGGLVGGRFWLSRRA